MCQRSNAVCLHSPMDSPARTTFTSSLCLLYQVRFAQTRMLHINNPCPVPFIVPHIICQSYIVALPFISFSSQLRLSFCRVSQQFFCHCSLLSVGCCPNLLHSSFERWLLDRRPCWQWLRIAPLKRTHLKVNSL